MRYLPSGTVTFLFTDIEGSTRLLHDLGAQPYAEALAEHRRVLREAFARHGGAEVDTQGDAFFVAFPTAPGAVAAAAEGQRSLETGPIRVRMGLHTGTPHLAEEGYVGEDVHRAARIAAAAHGGQVVLSAATAALVSDSLRDLGEHRLKDLSAAERLYQLGDGDFPPLRSLYHTNLPVPATPFLGRERELGELAGLLTRDDVRLLTLTGPGGTGKTRLALQAAGLAADGYPDGVFWVPLATLRDSQLVLERAARELGATVPLVEHVGARRLLLLFDNFEQVVEAAGDVAALLSACPNLSVLVTSRERLRVSGEQEYGVLGFAHEEGVGFFTARARSARPDFAPDGTVGEICRRLDDLPLALELAAARVKALSPEQLLERLDASLPILTGGARDLPERQRTLRATIEWSHDLLSPGERTLFRRLSIFVGGCTLDAAEEVAGADLDTLQSLVEKSLLRRTGERFWMLETIREYATERLEESGEADAIKRRHADFFLALAESANLAAERLDRGQRHELVAPEADNLRASMDWALAAGEIELAGSLGVALEQFWVVSSPYEGARRMAELLEHGDELPPQLRAQVLRVRGGTTYIVGEFEEGTRWHEAALEAFRELGDDERTAHLLFRQAVEANRLGDPVRARVLCEESLALHPSKAGEAQVLQLLGGIAFDEGRGEEALDLLRRSAAVAAEIGFRWWQNHAELTLADYALRLGRAADAEAHAAEGLRVAVEIHDRQSIVYGLALSAWVAAERGAAEKAGRLWGALEAEVEQAPVGQWEQERDEYASRIVSATPEFERGREQGDRLTLDQAVEEALHFVG